MSNLYPCYSEADDSCYQSEVQVREEAGLEDRASGAEASQAEAEQALATATKSEEAMRRALNAMQLRLVEESEARFRAERLWRYHASRG